MQKILNWTIICILSIVAFLWICEWQRVSYWWQGGLMDTMPYEWVSTPTTSTTELWEGVSIKENDKTIIVRLLDVFWLDNSIEEWRDLKFIDYARAIVNMALWLIAFIALIMSIYTFYMMFFTENEAGIKKAKWNLVGIFIALAIIWMAWIIVSFIFRWYQNNWKGEEEKLFPEVSVNYMDDKLDDQIYLTI